MLIGALGVQTAHAAPSGLAAFFHGESSSVLTQRALATFARGAFAQARQDFRALAVRGDSAAEAMLGTMAAHGQGTPRNHAVAAAWFLRAARRGYAPAELALAHSFAQGLGVPHDISRAVALADSAAIQGTPGAAEYAAHLRAQNHLPPADMAP